VKCWQASPTILVGDLKLCSESRALDALVHPAAFKSLIALQHKPESGNAHKHLSPKSGSRFNPWLCSLQVPVLSLLSHDVE
jgi:hypothetical protein